MLTSCLRSTRNWYGNGRSVVAWNAKEAIVPISKELLLKAVEGKAASRLLGSERTPSDEVVILYLEPQDERQDNLHKQSIRSEVKRLGGDDWRIHIASTEQGFIVEVRPAAGVALPSAMPVEVHAAVEPGPAVNGQEIDIDNPDKVKQLVASIEGNVQELAKILGVVLLAGPMLG